MAVQTSVKTRYSLFGLCVETNLPLPGLVKAPHGVPIDLHVCLGDMPSWYEARIQDAREWFVSEARDEKGVPVTRVWTFGAGAYYRIRWYDGVEFVCDKAGTNAWGTWPSSLVMEDALIYLVGPFMSFLLRLRSLVCLHGSAIAVDHRAIAIVGPAGAGKSTTAAAFARLGFPILAEDIIAIKDQGDSFLIQPGYPRIRLWPASVEALYGTPDALQLLSPNWDKRYVDLGMEGYRFHEEPLPLARIYLLGERSSLSAAPLVEVEATHAGMIALVANAHANRLLDKEMRGKEFNVLSRVAKHVPLRRLTPHVDIARLPDLCASILRDLES